MRIFPVLDRAVEYSNSSSFIVQEELEDKRRYIVFDCIKDYLRSTARTCHEVFVSTDSDFLGHIAFDLDLPLSVSPGWKEDFKRRLHKVLYNLYKVELADKDYIWIKSNNPSKISYHLIISNYTLVRWRVQMKEIVKCLKEKDPPKYIEGLDDGIYRRNGSLRLPFNWKYGKKNGILLFEDNRRKFHDGLVKIYPETSYTTGILLYPTEESLKRTQRSITYRYNPSPVTDIDKKLEFLLQYLERVWNAIFTIGNQTDTFIQLIRNNSSECPISGNIHDSDNAYCIVTDEHVMFGCYRGCTYKKGRKMIKLLKW